MSDMSEDDVNEFNQSIIQEFRDNDGVIGGPFEGATMVLLHHTGAKSGKARLNPLVYQAVGDSWAVFASKAGAPDNPDWYHNLKAHPDITIDVGRETFEVTARQAEGDEREQIWETQKVNAPQFAEYEGSTDRTIPVMILDRR